MLLTENPYKSFEWGDGEIYQYTEPALHRAFNEGIKVQLKKDLDGLEDALENSFVMAYVGEDEPYESTIDPITIREIIDDMKQDLLRGTE